MAYKKILLSVCPFVLLLRPYPRGKFGKCSYIRLLPVKIQPLQHFQQLFRFPGCMLRQETEHIVQLVQLAVVHIVIIPAVLIYPAPGVNMGGCGNIAPAVALFAEILPSTDSKADFGVERVVQFGLFLPLLAVNGIAEKNICKHRNNQKSRQNFLLYNITSVQIISSAAVQWQQKRPRKPGVFSISIIKSEADIQRPVDLLQVCIVQPAGFFFQALLVYGAYLFQKHHAVL